MCAVIFSLYFNIIWLQSIVLILTWLSGLISIFYLYKPIAIMISLINKNDIIMPHWLDVLYDFALVLIFGYYGWLWTGAIWMIQILGTSYVYHYQKLFKKLNITKENINS